MAVDRDRIERLASEGHRGAAGTLQGLRTLSFQLSGAQLGITVTSLLVGFVAEPTVARAIRPLVEFAGAPEGATLGISITLALALATGTQMVVGELIPKNLAIARPDGVAFTVVTPMRAVNTLWKPLVVVLNTAANWTVRRLGIEPREELTAVRSLQELELLIRSSRESGAILEDEFALLARSISFGEKTAADILVPRTAMAALPRTATIEDMARLALASGHSRFPVYGDDVDDIVGVAHVKDVYRVPPAERASTTVEAIVQEPLVVPESIGLEPLLLELRRSRRHLAVVVDEYGGTEGIATIEDIIEEIVGEIEDEYDARRPEAREQPVPAGVHVLDGGLHAEEVADACGFDMPEGPYDTLAGFVLWLLDRIPRAGDHVSYDGWEFKVVEMDGRRITRVLVVTPPDVEESE